MSEVENDDSYHSRALYLSESFQKYAELTKKGYAKVFRREKSSADVRVEDVTTSVARVFQREKSNSEVFKIFSDTST